jgi:hypothetical protein
MTAPGAGRVPSPDDEWQPPLEARPTAETPGRVLSHHYCGDCGSTRILFTLGTCAGCGKTLDGEPSPASRSEGMFHRACWLRHVREAATDESA